MVIHIPEETSQQRGNMPAPRDHFAVSILIGTSAHALICRAAW
jgi:hypothetical protein